MIEKCWRCAKDITNMVGGVVIMRKGTEQVTVCIDCAIKLLHNGWTEVARQK